MDQSASQRVPTVAQMLRMRASSDQRPHALSWTQRDSNQHLIPSFTAPIEPQIQAQASPSFLGVSPSPLQTLAPVSKSQPVLTPLLQEFMLTPFSPQNSCWLNMSPVASTPDSRFGLSPCVMVPISSPTEFWYSPYLPPHSLVLLPEVHTSWCPQIVPVHQPCGPDLVLRRTAQQVSEPLSVTPESAAKSEEEQQKNKTPEKDKLRANNTDDKMSEVSPGSLPPLDEETLAELAFEEYMTIMDSLSLQNQKGVEAKENEQDEDKEKLEIENDSILEYLEELCSNEDFVLKVESTLNTDFLVSTDPDPVDLLPLRELQQEPLEVILQQHLHPPPADSNSETPVTEETSPATSHVEAPILDPPGSQSDTNPNHDAPLSTSNIGSEEGWTISSPLLPEEPLPTDATRNYYNSVDAMSPLYYNGSLFMDCSFNSSLQPLANICPDTSLTSDLAAGDNDALAEEPAAIFPTADVPEEASESPSNLADTQSAQTSPKLQEGPPPGDPPASESTSGVSGSTEDPQANAVKDPVPSFRADLLTVSPPQSARPRKTPSPPPAQIREPEEQCSPKNINPNPCCLKDYAVPVPANSSFVADSHAESCDGNLSDLVPEKQKVEPPKGLQVSQEFASSGVSSKLKPGEWGETERKCERNPGEGVGKQTAIKAREEGMTKKTSERKEENKENETKVKGTTNTRHSRRLSGQIEKGKVRLKSEKGIKKTAKLTPERDGVISENQKRRSSGGRQLSKRDESRATKTAKAAEQFPEMGEKEHQKLAGGTQTLKVEGGEQCEAKDPNVSTENGAENALLTKTAQEEKDLCEVRVERKEEGVQMSSFVRRRTRSTLTEEKVQLKSSPKREMQEEVATEPQTLPVSSPMKRRSRSPRAQTDTRSTNGSIKEKPGEGPPEETNEPPSVKTFEENPNVTPILCPETRQQSKTADRQADRGETDQHGEVTGTETWDFYSLRSLNVSKRTVNTREATHHPSNPKPSSDQTEGINEEAERPGLIMLSPVKRYRHGRGASEEWETRVSETDVIGSSPTKRGRWKRRVEVNSERDEEQKLDEKGGDEAETSGCKPSEPSTGRNIKAKDKKISSLAGREAFKGGKSSAMETSSSHKGAHIACTRQTRLSEKLPTKYKDFILCNTNRRKRQLDKEKGKVGKTPRGWRKIIKSSP